MDDIQLLDNNTDKGKRHKGKHDKPKPLDDETVDHWKIENFDPSWNEGGLLEVSSFLPSSLNIEEKFVKGRQRLVGPNSSTLKKKAKEFGKQKAADNIDAEMYIAASGQPSKKKSKNKK